jgi:hypothetical protein
MLKVRINQADLFKVGLLLGGIEKGSATAISRAVNKGLDGVSPEVKSVVGSEINAKAKAVTSQVKVIKTWPGNLNGKAVIGEGAYGRGKGTALIDYRNSRQTKKGVTVVLKSGRSRTLIPGAFIATMRSGHRGVFRRAGYTNLYEPRGTKGIFIEGGKVITPKSPGQRREAIKELFSTSVVDAMGDNLPLVVYRVQARIDKELSRQVDLLLSK